MTIKSGSIFGRTVDTTLRQWRGDRTLLPEAGIELQPLSHLSGVLPLSLQLQQLLLRAAWLSTPGVAATSQKLRVQVLWLQRACLWRQSAHVCMQLHKIYCDNITIVATDLLRLQKEVEEEEEIIPTKLFLVCCYWLCFVFALFVVSDKYFRLQKVQTQFQTTKLLPDFADTKVVKGRSQMDQWKSALLCRCFACQKLPSTNLTGVIEGHTYLRTLPHITVIQPTRYRCVLVIAEG